MREPSIDDIVNGVIWNQMSLSPEQARILAESWRERGEVLAELLDELEGPINSRTGPRIERARAALKDRP